MEKLATWADQEINGENWTVDLYKDPSGGFFFAVDRGYGQEMIFTLTGVTEADPE
jgi:hypothetical protein